MEIKENEIDLSEKLQNIFSQGSTTDEELLRLTTAYAKQLSVEQIKALLLLKTYSFFCSETTKKIIENFIQEYINLKQFYNSDVFVMKALEYLSLKRFLSEEGIKVDIKR